MEYSLSSSLVSSAGSLGPSPSLDLRFGERKTITAVKGVTPTFSRSSSGTFIGDNGRVQTASTDAARIQRDTSYIGSSVSVTSIGALSEFDAPLPNDTLSFIGLDENNYPTFESSNYSLYFVPSLMTWYITYTTGDGGYVGYSETDLSNEYVMDIGNSGSLNIVLNLAGKGLIIEESSSNLIGYSTAFTNAYWDKTAGVTVSSAASLINLDGSGTAVLISDTGGDVTHHIHDLLGNFTTTAGTKYCMSCYVRNNQNSSQYIQLSFWTAGFGANAYTNFDILAGTVGTSGSSIASSGIEFVGNGWYRIWCVAPAAIAGSSGFQLALVNSSSATRTQAYTSDGRGVYLYGAQVEAKAFPTSFIKTTTSSSAARSAEVCDITGGDFTGIYNSTEFTLYAEASCPALVNNYIVGMDNGTSSEQADLISLSSGNFSSYVAAGGGTSAAINLSATAYSMTKLAASSKQNSFNFARNGTLGAADTSGNMPTLNNMKIGRGVGGNPVNGIIKSVRLYKTALPTTKLKSLTA